jgi:hypothetical protein
MKVHQTLEWLNLLSFGTLDLTRTNNRYTISCKSQHTAPPFCLYHTSVPTVCPAVTAWECEKHCCQIPPGLLGQFSQKNSAAGEKIRPQTDNPRNHPVWAASHHCDEDSDPLHCFTGPFLGPAALNSAIWQQWRATPHPIPTCTLSPPVLARTAFLAVPARPAGNRSSGLLTTAAIWPNSGLLDPKMAQ